MTTSQVHRQRVMRLSTVALVCALQLGCSSTRLAGYHSDIQAASDLANEYVSRSGESLRVDRVKGDFIPMETPNERKPLSAQLVKPVTFNQTSLNLRDFARQVEALTGVRVDVAPEAMTASQFGVPVSLTGTAAAQQTQALNGPPPGFPGLPGAAPGLPALNGAALNGGPLPGQTLTHVGSGRSVTLTDTDKSWRVVYEGTLAGLLDTVTRRFDLNWEEVDGRVFIRRFVTRTFRLVALAGTTSGSSTVSSGQALSGGGGGGAAAGAAGKSVTTGQSATVAFDGLSPWASVEATARTMLTAEGKLTVNPALGTVTVIDRQSVVERVAEFVRATNAAMGRQVALNVRVYSVQFNDGEQYAIDWDLLSKRLNGNQFTLQNASGLAATSASQLGVKVLSGSGRAIDGSSAIFSALSSQGRVSQQISTTLVTLNNQPVPLQVLRQISYLAAVSTTQVASAGTTTALTPGQVNSGLDMSFVPHVQDDGRILLQYTMTLSDLIRINSFSSGAAQIQLPDMDVRSFIQRVSVNSGETLVMSGFEQNALTSDQQGVGSAENFWLGGGQRASKARLVLVIVVQPTLI